MKRERGQTTPVSRLYRRGCMAALLLCFYGGSAAADDTAASSGWQFEAGGGPLAKPDYLGSDREHVIFQPDLQALYDDGAFYADLQDGIGFNPIGDGKSYAGGGLGYEFGRRVHDDGRNLAGTNNLRDSETANIHGHYETSPGYYAEGAVNAGLIGDYGIVATAALGQERDVTPNLSYDASVRVEAGNGRHMDKYFGIDSIAAKASGLQPYSTYAGLQDVAAVGEVDYSLSPYAYLAGTAQLTELVAEAAESPLTKQKLAPQAGISLIYKLDRFPAK